MAVIDHSAELDRAGANVSGFWRNFAFYARRYPLGAFGALLVVLFVLVALLAPWITSFDAMGRDPRVDDHGGGVVERQVHRAAV